MRYEIDEIPSKAKKKPYKQIGIFSSRIIFVYSKYEYNTKVLKGLKFVKLHLHYIEITEISVVEYRKKGLCKYNVSCRWGKKG